MARNSTMAASVNEMEKLQPSDSSTESYTQCQSRALQALQLFRDSEDAAHIDEALTNGRKANDIAADDPSCWAGARTVLGAILVERSQWSKDVTDIEEATKMLRGAVEAILGSEEHDEDTTSVLFTNLVTALSLRYNLSAQSQHLDDGIAILEDILPFTPLESPARRLCLGALSTFLDFVNTETQDLIYEDRAIQTAREAFALEHDTSVAISSKNQLITSLLKRHVRTQSLSDFSEAVELAAPIVERDDDPSNDSSAFENLVLKLGDLYQGRFEATNDIELLRRDIELNARLILHDERNGGEDPRTSAWLVISLRIKIALHIRATDTMPSDISIELLLECPELLQVLVPEGYPNGGGWLNDTAQRLRQHYKDVTQSETTAEIAVIASMMAMSETDAEHENWGLVEDGYRASWKLWSNVTGKMPEFYGSIMRFENSNRTVLPPESVEDLGLTCPCMIKTGKLDPEKEGF